MEAWTIEMLARIADAIPGLVAFVDTARRFRYANANYQTWFGRAPSTYLGQHMRDVLGPSYAVAEPFAERALAGEGVQFRNAVVCMTGRREAAVQYIPIRSSANAVVGFAAIVLDISVEASLAHQLQHATDRMQRLLVVAGQLARANTDDEVVSAVVDAGLEAIGASLASMWLLDPASDVLHLVRQRGYPPELHDMFKRVPRSANNGPGEALRTGKPVWVASRAEYRARYPETEQQTRPSTEQQLAFGVLPIEIRGKTAGALMFGVRDERRFTADERTYVEILASQAGDALSRVRLHAERDRVERGRNLVAEAAAVLARSLDLDHTIRQVVTLPIGLFADWACIDLLDRDQLVRMATTTENVPRRLAHEPERGGASAAIATGEPQLLSDVDDATLRHLSRDHAHYTMLRDLGMRSFLSVPMRVGFVVIGAFSFGSRTRNFDAVDVSVAQGLAMQAATAVDNARLYRQAHAARRDAEAANRAKDEFLAMLGHELRNPLAPMRSALDLMALRGITSRESEVIDRQVTHLERLVDDLLDVARITRGMIELTRTRTSVASVISRALELSSPLLQQRRHDVIVEVPPALAVDGDPTRLAQVFTNLIANSARYTDPAGRITVRARADGDQIVVSVRDNGIGIAPDVLPRIFDMFVQGPQTLERTQGGLGLGLAIVSNLVELHGGTVSARSEGIGKGSELEVRLPAARSAASPATPRAPARPHRKRRRILIVDDNQDAARLLGELLDEHGHEIRTAFDGHAALDIATDFCPEIVLLDIGLPQMDGYELARRLRADPKLAAVRLIAVTGYGQSSDRERSRGAGIEHHVAKPIAIEKLIELVE